MYPFVPRERLVQIFGKDLYQSPESIPIVRALAGLETKPFECVGTSSEIVAALSLGIEMAKKREAALPPVLAYAMESIPGVGNTAATQEILSSYGPHRLAPVFERSLTSVLNESPRSR
jgi:hypothetical protein